jgi:peptidyl-tRNA hydrolase
VLSKFLPDEVPVIEQAVTTAANAVVDWASQGIEYCMNQYN